MKYGIEDIQDYMKHSLYAPGVKDSAPTSAQIADDVGVSTVTVYKWLENDNRIPLQSFIRLYRSTRGLLLPVLKLMVHLCDSRLVLWRISSNVKINGSFQDEKDGITIKLGDITAFLNTALEDKELDETERIEALDKLNALRELIDRFIKEVQHYGEK